MTGCTGLICASSPAPTPACPTPGDYLINNRRHLVINNGSAGLANFRDTTYGVITRLSGQPEQPTDALYATKLGLLRCDALPIRFDLNQWMTHFLDQWPPGSAAHDAYHARITHGTPLRHHQAARGTITLSTSPS